ncbi:MAG: haloacid dehalogenase-like hydrolase [Holophaga sp.]|nr:haloacid dehalogenase-like hydrolase [Holophaga sp.]
MPLCFDLDGTLGHFGGGFLILLEALGDLWGEPPSQAELALCAGSTDWEIVDQLHAMRFGGPIPEEVYAAYDRACATRFAATFHPEGRLHTAFEGIIAGMAGLADRGHQVWLVSGNTPSVLEFKARTLGVDPRIPRLGSLPHLDRAGLIRKALQGSPGPNLYVGDRPHDLLAAERAGVPFLGVGNLVPGEHPILGSDAEAEHLVQAVEAILRA